MWQSLYNHFQFAKRKTSLKKEIIGGLITFFAMMYILPVNSVMLNDFGTGAPEGAIYLATALTAGFSSLLVGMYANLPMGIAPGMGLNVFFISTIVNQFGLSFGIAFSIVILNGLIFALFSLFGIINKFIEAIPNSMKAAAVFALGLYLTYIGLQNSGLIMFNSEGLGLGDLKEIGVLLTLIGIVVIFVLTLLNLKMAILITLLAIALIGMIIGQIMPNHFEHGLSAFTDIRFDYSQLKTIDQVVGQGFLAFPEALSNVKTYIALFGLMFMTIATSTGTIVSVGQSANLVTEDGEILGSKQALIATGISSFVAGALGTSSTSGFLESNAGIAAGARTGLSAIVTGLMFFLSIVLFPILQPLFGHAFVTSPILVFVGSSMAKNGQNIEWKNPSMAASAFILIVMMIFSASILNGFAFGVIAYVIFELASKRAKQINIYMYIFALLFTIYLIAMPFLL